MTLIFRIFLAFNATSLLIVVYLFNTKTTFLEHWHDWLNISITYPNLSNFIPYLLYCITPILLTYGSTFLFSFLSKDSFKVGDIKDIALANNIFLPSYLGYFFVALSINNIETFWIIYPMVFLFTLLSQAHYFNPFFLLFGYDFYSIETQAGSHLLLISKKNYKKPSDVSIDTAYRINNGIY